MRLFFVIAFCGFVAAGAAGAQPFDPTELAKRETSFTINVTGTDADRQARHFSLTLMPDGTLHMTHLEDAGTVQFAPDLMKRILRETCTFFERLSLHKPQLGVLTDSVEEPTGVFSFVEPRNAIRVELSIGANGFNVSYDTQFLPRDTVLSADLLRVLTSICLSDAGVKDYLVRNYGQYMPQLFK